jgi:mannose-6-phosphate isomerase-like protein (cupin superfamily)
MEFSTQPFQKKIEKPWGHEIIYAPEEIGYAGKILFVRARHKLSLQYHDQKVETVCLFSGEALIWMENSKGEIEKILMEPFKGYTISANQKHRIEAIQESYILESSLPETGTTYRVEDDFQRSNETEEVRKEENRGWTE